MKNELIIAITQLCAEKNLPRETVLDALEAALVSAYKRNFGSNQNISVKILPNTGEAKVYAQKAVVETVTDRKIEITLDEARKIDPQAEIGANVDVETPRPQDFGRIAAQTAKQVVLQRLREAEREAVYEEFIDKEGDIVSGTIQRIEPKQIIIDFGKAEAILPQSEQVHSEHYRSGQRIKVYLLEVHRTSKGPQVLVSRTHRNLLRRLFELEVPEIFNGLVELKSIAREAGSRSKVAVAARQEGVDPVGSCVGLRGIRIQNIVNELNGEKVDVVQWHPDAAIFVANALSPAQVLGVEVDEADKTANVVVPDRQLSLAIGKEGQNARLAAKLTGWRIDIKASSTAKAEKAERAAREAAMPTVEEMLSDLGLVETPAVEPVEAPQVGEPVHATMQEAPEFATEVTAPEGAAAQPEATFEAPEEVESAPQAIEIERPVAETQPAEVTEFYQEPVEELAKPVEKPQIRFAEDILSTPAPARPDTRGRKGKTRKETEDEEEAAKAKKPKRQRVYYEGEEEEVDAYDFLKRPRK